MQFDIESVIIRPEKRADFPSIKTVNNQAFGQPQEGIVIEKIRNIDPFVLSLVAEINHTIVGHIFFSAVQIDAYPEIKNGIGLAPMAVLPKYQNCGIGKKLIETGIRILKEKSVPFVIVLGHPEYYPKFGFERASKYKLSAQWEEVPDEAFMVLILDQQLMSGISGIARYREEWDEAM